MNVMNVNSGSVMTPRYEPYLQVAKKKVEEVERKPTPEELETDPEVEIQLKLSMREP